MNIEKHKAFLDSLDGEKGLHACPECNGSKCDYGDGLTPCNYCGGAGVSKGPGLLNGIPLDADLSDVSEKPDEDAWFSNLREAEGFIEYLIERCRRAESRQIPNLKEKVKELMRDAMDAEKNPEFAHIFNVRYGCLEYDEKGNPVYPIYSATGKRIGKSYAIQSVKAEP